MHGMFGYGARTSLSQDIQKVTPPPKNKKDLEKFIPFTKKWRVKLYILNKEGQWIDKGIGYVFCANESEEEANIGGGKQNSGQLIKKLIMLEEKTEEIIFNLDIRKEGAEFHNQRGTIITWKKPNTVGEDNTAISFQEKEGVIEILKNIKIINGKNISVEDETVLYGIEGRCVELFITVRPKDPEKLFQKFSLRFAQNEKYRSSLSFRPHERIVKIDRK